MMSDSTNNNKVNGHIMSLQQLISAPLVATIDADAMSTERYMKHFMSLAFESYNPVDGSTGPGGTVHRIVGLKGQGHEMLHVAFRGHRIRVNRCDQRR